LLLAATFGACGARAAQRDEASAWDEPAVEQASQAEEALIAIDDAMRHWRQHQPAFPTQPEIVRDVLARPSRAHGLQAPAGSGFTTDAGRLRSRSSAQLRVDYAAYAAEPLVIEDRRSGVSAQVSLDGASQAPAEALGGFVVYPRGGPYGSDVVYRPRHDGAEDYLYFATRPPQPLVSYTLALGEQVAGLRLVANILELVDAAGTPRIRVRARMLVDADGRAHRITLAVVDCAVDTDQRVPWGRQPVSPGADRCQLQLGWDDRHVSYPAVLDPSWTETTNMAFTHFGHTATRLDDGRVLVVGGNPLDEAEEESKEGGGPIAAGDGECEIFDPTTETWSTAGNIIPRRHHSATLLDDGRVFIVGGESLTQEGDAPNQTAQIYEPEQNDWGGKTSDLVMALEPRRFHAALLLSSGKVLLTGGLGGKNDLVLSSTEKVDPNIDPGGTGPSRIPVFSIDAPMQKARMLHTITETSNGEIYVAGGVQGVTLRRSVELYDFNPSLPQPPAWHIVGDMHQSRFLHTTTALADNRLLVTGGLGAEQSAENFNPKDLASGDLLEMTEARFKHTATILADSSVLLVGGGNGPGTKANAELIHPTSAEPRWRATGPMQEARSNHAATLLADGRVLVTGGVTATGDATNSVEIFERTGDGVPCEGHADCESELCVDSYCCDTACASDCESCGLAGTEGICSLLQAGSVGAGNCSPYLCSGESADCPTSCENDDICYADTICRPDGQCGDTIEDGSACNVDGHCTNSNCVEGICCAESDCNAYRCTAANGTCRDSCDSSADCASGYACDETEHCVAAVTFAPMEFGCTWSAPTSSRSNTWLGIVFALFWLRRRREAA